MKEGELRMAERVYERAIWGIFGVELRVFDFARYWRFC